MTRERTTEQEPLTTNRGRRDAAGIFLTFAQRQDGDCRRAAPERTPGSPRLGLH